ncbi:hypothetical protein [Alteromonas australica]|uniref:hypothetical protein n=1 Tax=Alteromonas australica TaxID=589873 RepID=UPI003F66B180
MSRPVSCDHVLFDECINAFRIGNDYSRSDYGSESYSYLLTPFKLTKNWDLSVCSVSQSNRVSFPGAYSAFISKVKNPKWVSSDNPHLFGIALSTIVSFVSLKDCKSTRDDYLCRHMELTENDLMRLGILHPILVAGPGCTITSISQAKQFRLENEVTDIISKLMSMEYEKYRLTMQSLRLIQLSLSTKRDDFGLAYLLVVSAIESVAQKAISRNRVKEKHPKEKLWKKRANDDPCFKEVLEVYLESRGKNEYLKERFVRFLSHYAPADKWVDYVEHPLQDLADYIQDVNPLENVEYLTGRDWFQKSPEDLTKKEIERVLSDAYIHRSCFVHRGEQPPHKDPISSSSRFFQEGIGYDGNNLRERILPNYNLLIGLARGSIFNWICNK